MRAWQWRAVWSAMLGAVVSTSVAWADVRPLVVPPADATTAAAGVDVYLLNDGAAPEHTRGPDSLVVNADDGSRLVLAPDPMASAVTIAPGRFARQRYRAVGNVLPAGVVTTPANPPQEATAVASAGTSQGFLSRFRTNEPIYGVFGTSGAGGKLQFSFGFRALGRADAVHLDFAYTQTMFWALGEPSAPFSATTYSPDIFVEVPAGEHTVLGIGYRHDSNGEGAAKSVDSNRLMVRATRRVPLGNQWSLDLTPQAWAYVGERGVARHLDRYFGYTGLGATIGQADGIKLALYGRGNPGTGRGSLEGFLSYPLVAIDRHLPPIYLFGQAFTGYGEAISDYDRRSNYARFGVALTR